MIFSVEKDGVKVDLKYVANASVLSALIIWLPPDVHNFLI